MSPIENIDVGHSFPLLLPESLDSLIYIHKPLRKFFVSKILNTFIGSTQNDVPMAERIFGDLVLPNSLKAFLEIPLSLSD